MSATILVWAIAAAQVMLVVAMALHCYRMIRGPRAQDRVLASTRSTSAPCCCC